MNDTLSRIPHEETCTHARTGDCTCSREHFIMQAARFQQLWADEARANRGIRKALTNLLEGLGGRAKFHEGAGAHAARIEDGIIVDTIEGILVNPTAALDD